MIGLRFLEVLSHVGIKLSNFVPSKYKFKKKLRKYFETVRPHLVRENFQLYPKFRIWKFSMYSNL